MITADGYSKDPNIIPEGIAITWSKEMIVEGYGNLLTFIRHFKECISDEDGIWLQKCKNKPKIDVAYVYIIFSGRIRYRVQYVGYEAGPTTVYDDNGPKDIQWSRLLLVGPMVEAPRRIPLKGFQGPRYTTKLF